MDLQRGLRESIGPIASREGIRSRRGLLLDRCASRRRPRRRLLGVRRYNARERSLSLRHGGGGEFCVGFVARYGVGGEDKGLIEGRELFWGKEKTIERGRFIRKSTGKGFLKYDNYEILLS